MFKVKNIASLTISASIFLICYFIIVSIGAYRGLDPLYIIRDPAQVCSRDWMIGAISNIGITAWAASSSICIFIRTCLSKYIPTVSKRLFLNGGILSVTMTIDDLFMIHESIRLEFFIFLGYALYGIYLFFLARKIHGNCKNFFYASVFLLGGSVLIDIIQGRIPMNYSTVQLLEEAAKFSGIMFWLQFWFSLGKQSVNFNSTRRGL